ncbi:MAG: hypothetical protein VXY56_04640 [Pseudomonadota bacterium]|nr:hypothetical protein [Pseudomonadota bacterium]
MRGCFIGAKHPNYFQAPIQLPSQIQLDLEDLSQQYLHQRTDESMPHFILQRMEKISPIEISELFTKINSILQDRLTLVNRQKICTHIETISNIFDYKYIIDESASDLSYPFKKISKKNSEIYRRMGKTISFF